MCVPVYERINLELFLLCATVQNKIGAVQHEVGDFVALSPETLLDELEDQAAKSTARHYNPISLFQVNFRFFHNLLIVLGFGTACTPLPIELLDGCSDF